MDANTPDDSSNPLDEQTRVMIDAAMEGDPEAWEQIDRRHRGVFALLMRGRIPSGARRRFDTEDLYQSAMFCAYREIKSFEYRGPGSFRAWLTTIFINRIRQQMRSHRAGKRDFTLDQSLESYDQSVRDSAKVKSPSELWIKAEEHTRCATAIAELSDEQQQLIVRYHVDGEPYRVIAEELGIPETSARRALAVALRQLEKQLDSNGSSEIA